MLGSNPSRAPVSSENSDRLPNLSAPRSPICTVGLITIRINPLVRLWGHDRVTLRLVSKVLS